MSFTRRYALQFALLAALALVLCIALTARLGFQTAEIRGERAVLEAGEARIETLKTPRPPARLRPLVAGPARSLEALAGEQLNLAFSTLGLTITHVETVSRRPFGAGLESLFLTVRGHGDAAAGAKVLAWLDANSRAIAVEQVNAYPGEGASAEWTFKLIVLVAPTDLGTGAGGRS